MEKNTADTDPKHLISFGPFKKHVLDVVRPLMIFDLGYCSNIVMVLVVAPSLSLLLVTLLFVAPAVLTLMAAKNGNKTYALIPLVFSIIFFVAWTLVIVLSLLMVSDLYKIVHYVLWRYLKEEEMAKREAVHQPFNQPFHPSAPPAAYQGSYQGYEAPQPQLVLNNVY